MKARVTFCRGKNADSDVNPIERVINKVVITMSFTKTLIAASHAIGAAVMLSLVVPDVPADVVVHDVQMVVKYSSGLPTARVA